MVKKYEILNSCIVLEADSRTCENVDLKSFDIPMFVQYGTYHVKYVQDTDIFTETVKKYDMPMSDRIIFYGQEYKNYRTLGDLRILSDQNSIIIINGHDITIIGANDKAIDQIIYLFREIVYEEFLLNGKLLLHSAGVEKDNRGISILGSPGSGKTTMMFELLKRGNCSYISNDLLAIDDDKIRTSIIPIRIAYGTLSRFFNVNDRDLSQKETYRLKEFLTKYGFEYKCDAPLSTFVFPRFNRDNYFNMEEIDRNTAAKIILNQCFNINDPVRPFMWVNNFNRQDVMSEEEVIGLIKSYVDKTDCYIIDYSYHIDDTSFNQMAKELKIR